jgi:hypothetical protein
MVNERNGGMKERLGQLSRNHLSGLIAFNPTYANNRNLHNKRNEP